MDWETRSVKTPEDFHACLWAGSGHISHEFAAGYAQALYDAGVIEEDGLMRYVAAACQGEFAHNLDFPPEGEGGAEQDEMNG
jgi:hypothetical protein